MRGRTLYVVPIAWARSTPPSRAAESRSRTARTSRMNMIIMTRGRPALELISRTRQFVKGLHSTGELDPNRRFIVHFPEELAIESFGSGYGGNALLGKKCHALRIASYQARPKAGWPNTCSSSAGKAPRAIRTTLPAHSPRLAARQIWRCSSRRQSMPGLEGLHGGRRHRLARTRAPMAGWAINPEAGYFGVAPGPIRETNRNAYDMIRHDTLFTNVALTADNQPWWEGLSTALRSRTGRDGPMTRRRPRDRPHIPTRVSPSPPAQPGILARMQTTRREYP